MKSWSCWNSNGDNFRVLAIFSVACFSSLSRCHHHYWWNIYPFKWVEICCWRKDGPDPDKVQFYLITFMIRSFHVEINSLSHTESGHLSRAFGSGFISPFSLVSYCPRAYDQWLWLAECFVFLSLKLSFAMLPTQIASGLRVFFGTKRQRSETLDCPWVSHMMSFDPHNQLTSGLISQLTHPQLLDLRSLVNKKRVDDSFFFLKIKTFCESERGINHSSITLVNFIGFWSYFVSWPLLKSFKIIPLE